MTVAVSVSIFFWNPMGNSLEAYRSAIGMFYNCSRISSKCVLVQADSYRNILLTNLRCSFLFVSLLVLQSLNPNVNVVFLLFVLHFILMIGNVELNPGPETYISSSPPNLDNSSNDNSISLCNINIRSIRNKTNFVQHFVDEFDILVITESHLDNSTNTRCRSTVDGMYCIKEKIDPSRESEPKDFHLNYSLVGLSLKCLHFFSYKSEALSHLILSVAALDIFCEGT
jgi:hypothetical protein